jgi:hypothetical protein
MPTESPEFFSLRSSGVADHREAIGGLLVSTPCLSLLMGKRSSERPGAVQGAPLGAAKRTLDGEDRSEMMDKEGKQVRSTPVDF